MAEIKAVRKLIHQLDICADRIYDEKTLSHMHEASFMTYRIIKGLQVTENILDVKFMSHPNYGPTLLLACLDWDQSMNNWTAKQWTYFALEVASKLKLSNDVICIIPSYKLQYDVTYEKYEMFVKNMNQNINPLVSNNSKFSQYVEDGSKLAVLSENADDIQQDLAMHFEALLSEQFFQSFLNSIQMNQTFLSFTPLQKYPKNMNIDRILNALKQTVRKANTYHDFGKIYVRDENCNVYNGHYEYILSRLNDAFIFNIKYKNSNQYEYKYCAQVIYDMLRLNVDGKVVWSKKLPKGAKLPLMYAPDQFSYPYDYYRRRNIFRIYIIPRRHRIMYRKYGTYLPIEYRKKCDVCGFIEKCIGLELLFQMKSKIQRNFVDKIYCCPCLTFYACSRKCQKIGWVDEKFNHRKKCSRRLWVD